MDRIRLAALIVLLAMESICPNGLAKEPLPGAALFGRETVPRFHIQIAPDQFEQLRRTNRTYVRATVTVGTNMLRDVGVRLKGHGSFRPLKDRPSLTLKFDKLGPFVWLVYFVVLPFASSFPPCPPVELACPLRISVD